MSSSAVAQMPIGNYAVIEFGPFRFDPARREIVDRNGPLRVGSRALQILDVLLECPGRLYSRKELVERVWPRTVVEETSLRVHMSALRRAIGDGVDGARYISNVPGRGYTFVGETRKLPKGNPPAQTSKPEHLGANAPALPSRRTRAIGRDTVIAQLSGLLTREHLVSIVGAGGMGKTTVALSVAQGMRSAFESGVFLVDLSKISDPAFVVVELGQTQDLNISPGDSPSMLEATLRDKRMLFVVDNCEHVIDAVASLAHRLLNTCPLVHFLATSREPLEVEGEWVFKLPPLAAPETNERLDVVDLLAYPAIQLFVERAKATSDAFELSEATAPAVRQLCQFLDGIPLAIELAAARVDSLGVQGLASRLESVLELLTRGRRTGLSRHRTLQALLDWSYDLLSDSEKRVLERLSVFRGAFDLDGAVMVASCPCLSRQVVIADVLSLCAKSLITLQVVTEDDVLLHRLLYITRLYAEKRLADAPDAHDVHRRHAAVVLDRLQKKQQAGVGMYHYAWSPGLDSGFADLRAALEWAMVQEHDLALGLELTAQALRSYRDVGLVEEYRHHVATALGKVSRVIAERERLELGLRVAAAFMTGFATDGGRYRAAGFSRTRELIDHIGSDEDRIESLYGICVGLYGQGDYRAALAVCEEIRLLATGEFEPLSVVISDRLSVLCLHALGEHDTAVRLAHSVMAFNGAPVGRRFLSEVPFGSSLRTQLARIHWLRGDFSLAWATLLEALEYSAGAHFFARCQVLGTTGIPLAIWMGNLALADEWTTDLMDVSDRKQLPYWQGFAWLYRAALNGDDVPFGNDLRLSLEKYAQLNDMATVLMTRPPTAAAVLRVENGTVGWSAPEVLRRAALPDVHSINPTLRSQAVDRLQRGMTMAKAQGARFWMLRIALTVCSASLGGEMEQAARSTLHSILPSLDNGLPIAELVAARALLKGRA